MWLLRKLYIILGKITHLSLHLTKLLRNLINTNNFWKFLMNNNDLKEKKFHISDPIENYFECISSCDIADGNCISQCVEILKDHEN